MTYAPYFAVDQVDESADVTDMTGDESLANQGISDRTGGLFATPTRGLVSLWFLAAGVYVFLGWFFKGQRH